MTGIIDQQGCEQAIKAADEWLHKSTSGKVLLEEGGLASLTFLVELIKSAWEFGQAKNSSFNKFIYLMKQKPYLHLFMYTIACFRLTKRFEIPEQGFKSLVEYCTVVLNQGVLLCDMWVAAKILCAGEMYYRVKTTSTDQKEYLFDELKKNRVFQARDFWENYLIWSVINNAKDSSHFTRSNVDQASLRRTALDAVGSVFLSIIFEMNNANLDKTIAREFMLSNMDRFKLDEKNRAQILAFYNSSKK